MMTVRIIPNTQYWIEVHRDGCSHINRVSTTYYGRGWTAEVESLTDIAIEAGSDFLNEGSMTMQDVLRDIHFAPCVRLPMEAS